MLLFQDLYREIVSQARVVGACIRASDNKSTIDSNSSNKNVGGEVESRRNDNNSKALERRYHLLYLKAIEIQCMFEGLLGKKDSASVSLN